MDKKNLIITDNEFLYTAFRKIAADLSMSNSFEYGCSTRKLTERIEGRHHEFKFSQQNYL
jgi:hypothetical protein